MGLNNFDTFNKRSIESLLNADNGSVYTCVLSKNNYYDYNKGSWLPSNVAFFLRLYNLKLLSQGN